jgi:hypothetical protein
MQPAFTALFADATRKERGHFGPIPAAHSDARNDRFVFLARPRSLVKSGIQDLDPGLKKPVSTPPGEELFRNIPMAVSDDHLREILSRRPLLALSLKIRFYEISQKPSLLG